MHKLLLTPLAAALLAAPALAQSKPTAVFAGMVVDSIHQPIPNAEVSFPGLSMSRLTDEKGAFRLPNIPAGAQRVVVRRIGFGQLDTTFVFVEDQTVLRRVTLGRVVLLDSVFVGATRGDPLMDDFEENRARGFGRFVTRTELDKMEGRTLGAVLSQLQGVGVLRGPSGQAWLIGRRAPISRCPPMRPSGSAAEMAAAQRQTDDCLRTERLYYVPDNSESQQGVTRACYAIVYLDRSPLNQGHPTFPFDANTFTASQLQGIEWYESASEVPQKYGALDARCGLAVFHTRRGT